MRATVYKIHDKLGVAYLNDGPAQYVGECVMDGNQAKIIPQSVRQIEHVFDTDMDFDDDPTHIDIVNRMHLRVRRLRDRLEEFENDDVSEGDPKDLVLECIACRDELNGLIQRFTLVRL